MGNFFSSDHHPPEQLKAQHPTVLRLPLEAPTSAASQQEPSSTASASPFFSSAVIRLPPQRPSRPPVDPSTNEVLVVEDFSDDKSELVLTVTLATVTASASDIADRLASFDQVRSLSLLGPNRAVEKVLACLVRLPQLTDLLILQCGELTLPAELALLHQLRSLTINSGWVRNAQLTLQMRGLHSLSLPDMCDFHPRVERHIVGLPLVRELSLGTSNVCLEKFDFRGARELETLFLKSIGPNSGVRQCPAVRTLKHVVFKDARLGTFEDLSALDCLETVIYYRCSPPPEFWKHTFPSVKTILFFEVPLPEDLDLHSLFPKCEFAALYGVERRVIYPSDDGDSGSGDSKEDVLPPPDSPFMIRLVNVARLTSLALPGSVRTLIAKDIDLSRVNPAVFAGVRQRMLLGCDVAESLSNLDLRWFRLPSCLPQMVRRIETSVHLPRSWG